jgi:hypothetical protein
MRLNFLTFNPIDRIAVCIEFLCVAEITLPQRHTSATSLTVSAAKPGGYTCRAVEMVCVVSRSQLSPVRWVYWWIRFVACSIVGSL